MTALAFAADVVTARCSASSDRRRAGTRFTYPPIGGFDAGEHIAYARACVDDGGLPDGGASYTPPGFYVLAGVAIGSAKRSGWTSPSAARSC